MGLAIRSTVRIRPFWALCQSTGKVLGRKSPLPHAIVQHCYVSQIRHRRSGHFAASFIR